MNILKQCLRPVMHSQVQIGPLPPLVDVSVALSSPQEEYTVSIERETRLTLTVMSNIFAPAHLNHASIKHSKQYKNAEKMINRHVYGPTMDALLEVMHLIYQHDEDGAIQRIQGILKELDL